MIMKTGFDNKKYLEEQSRAILERINRFKGKLYLEFGGKLLYDHHAARVLPGYEPNIKVKLLSQLKDKIDIILCIYAGDIEKGRIRGDFGITYDVDALKLIDGLRENVQSRPSDPYPIPGLKCVEPPPHAFPHHAPRSRAC